MNPISYPSSRVSQLDAGILDTELFSLLKDQVKSIFQLHETSGTNSYASHLSYSKHPELYSLLLNLLIFKLTVWKSGASYGSSLQNLKLTNVKNGQVIGLNKKGLLLAVVVGTYLYKRVETLLYQMDENEIEAEASGDYDSIRYKFKSFVVNNRNKVLTKIDDVLKIANLLNFTMFLVNGKYSSIVHRLFGITETPLISDLLKFNGSNVNYEFQNRQLVWNVMTEFLVFLLPLLQVRKLRSTMGKLLSKGIRGNTVDGQKSSGNMSSSSSNSKFTRYRNLPLLECAICHDNNDKASRSGGRVFATAGPVTNPCITNCGHVYCYVCIATQFNIIKSSGDSVSCLRCDSKLEWFQEFEADEKAIDVDAIVVEQEDVENEGDSENNMAQISDDEDIQSLNSIKSDDDGDDDGDDDDNSSNPYLPEKPQSFSKLERRLSHRLSIFEKSEYSAELSENDDDDYSEEEEMEADETMF